MRLENLFTYFKNEDGREIIGMLDIKDLKFDIFDPKKEMSQ